MSDEREKKEPEPGPRAGSASRRTFLKAGTVATGGVITVVVAAPLARYAFYPVGREVVSSSDAPIDIGLKADDLEPGAAPVKVELVAAAVRDAWTVKSGVAVGAAWVRKNADGEIVAFTSTCPHLGCSVSFRPQEHQYRCPCHDSTFALDGEHKGGPAKRGLDPLPVAVDAEGRVKLTFKRYREDVAERIEV